MSFLFNLLDNNKMANNLGAEFTAGGETLARVVDLWDTLPRFVAKRLGLNLFM